MSWASRRRAFYLFGVLLLAAVVLAFIGVRLFYEAPTCFDGIQNGDEGGIDCGGACQRVCSFQAVDPVVRWTRFFEIRQGVYSVVALVENPNVGAHAYNVPYDFKLRDESGILIYERKGTAYIPPESTFALFETDLATGERKPRRGFLEFSDDIPWQRATSGKAQVRVRDEVLVGTENEPRVRAVIQNITREEARDVELVALVFNTDGNAIAVSKTLVDRLPPGGQKEVFFTWPRAFDETVALVSVLPRIISREP